MSNRGGIEMVGRGGSGHRIDYFRFSNSSITAMTTASDRWDSLPDHDPLLLTDWRLGGWNERFLCLSSTPDILVFRLAVMMDGIGRNVSGIYGIYLNVVVSNVSKSSPVLDIWMPCCN